jgi:hypothetical protein
LGHGIWSGSARTGRHSVGREKGTKIHPPEYNSIGG